MKKIFKYCCYIVSIILLIAFVIIIISDYNNRENLITINFNTALKIRIIEFILPSLILFTVGTIIKEKDNK